MKAWWMKRVVAFAAMAVVMVAAVGGVVMLLWNALIPDLFGGPVITYWQAVGLLVLSHILFRGFGRWRGHLHPMARDRWKHKLEEKLAAMTPDEREQFRAEWKRRCGWEPGDMHGAPKPEEKHP